VRGHLRPSTLVVALAFAVTTAPAFAATIAPAEAKAHVGETATVEGTVDEVYTARSGVTFLDMGGRYPNETFTGVIFAGDAGKFPNVHALQGKTVDITGPVRLYRGRPEIILNDAGQLKAK
jgi:DNA/RNA endonuclease YhcR with UshA esterase domain